MSLAYLKPLRDRLQLMLVDLDLASGHVRRLFGVERVRDAARHEHVQLDAALALLLLALVLLLQVLLVTGAAARRAGRRVRTRQRVGPRRAVERLLRGAAACRKEENTHMIVPVCRVLSVSVLYQTRE